MEIKKTLGLGSKALEGRDKPAAVDKAAQKTATASGAEAQAAAGDRVEISDRSREMAKAAEVLASTPEIRQQKVEEIKNRIENEEYEVDADKVAHKMIMDFLADIT